MILRRIATTVAAATALAMAGAGPAFAEEAPNTVPLQKGQAPTVAEDFSTQECDDDQFDVLNLDDTNDGWHFVAPAQTGGFVELALTFTDLDNADVDVLIESQDPNSPSMGPGWAGYLSEVGQGDVRHAWVVTDAGWTLEGGTAEMESAGGHFFVLSHTCLGAPGDDDDGGDDGDGEDGKDGDEDEDETPAPKTSKSPAAVPTAVPAGTSGSGDASMAPIGIAAAALIVMAGGAALVRGRFAHQS